MCYPFLDPGFSSVMSGVRWPLVMDSLFELWDGFELWLVQLPYPLLVTLVLVVLVPTAWAVSRLLDHGVDIIAARLSRVPGADPPLRSADAPTPEAATAPDRMAPDPKASE